MGFLNTLEWLRKWSEICEPITKRTRKQSTSKYKRNLWDNWQLHARSNSPFLSSDLPLCQNESKCETILMKMCFTYKLISCKSNSFAFETFCTKTRFETEANQDSEMGYCRRSCFALSTAPCQQPSKVFPDSAQHQTNLVCRPSHT